MNNTLALLIVLVFTNAGLRSVQAQENTMGLVKYQIEAPKEVQTGKEFTISAVFNVQPGWFVYAPLDTNIAQGKIPTTITFKKHEQIRKVGNLILPDITKGYHTYSGTDIRMSQKFRVPKELESGKQTIEATIVYQTCNEKICFPPVRENIDIVITVE